MIEHLYLHIPFCLQICPYCSFYKEPARPGAAGPLVEALLREAKSEAERLQPRTIFLGGGTPTALSLAQLDRLLGGLASVLDLRAVEEWTIEMNPATVTAQKAALLRARGVNRVSMGVQSWDAGLLRTLGRVHDADQVERSFAILREAGFANLNLDLMFGVPGQTAELWSSSLRRTVNLGPEHISTYCLTYEEDTEYFRRLQRGEFRPDEDVDAAFHEEADRVLGEAGYEAYEISNHAKPGFACRHNLAYWRGADYVGLGPSAFSTAGGQRWQNVADTAAYIAAIERGDPARSFVEPLPPATRHAERLAFGLRTAEGVERELLDPGQLTVQRLLEEGLLEAAGARLRLSPRGRLLADEIAAELM